MSTDEDRNQTIKEKRAAPQPGTFSPVTVHMKETVGTVFLGIIALVLLIAWLQAEAHQRRNS
jgi:hypothetical protein